jgi:hypothetical protein
MFNKINWFRSSRSIISLKLIEGCMLEQRLEIMRQERTNKSELQNELAERRSLARERPALSETSRGK